MEQARKELRTKPRATQCLEGEPWGGEATGVRDSCGTEQISSGESLYESTEVIHGVIVASIVRAECQRGKNDRWVEEGWEGWGGWGRGSGTGRRGGANLRR